MTPTRSPTPTRSIGPGTFPIILTCFHQLNGREHWTLNVIESSQCIYTFEIRGNRDSYTYVSDQLKNLDRVDSYRGGCHVGNVPRDGVKEMRTKLTEVVIHKQEPWWSPQTWILDCIKHLRDIGWTFAGLNEMFLRRELQKDASRWELVEDTVYERMLQELESGKPVSPVKVILSAENGQSPSSDC